MDLSTELNKLQDCDLKLNQVSSKEQQRKFYSILILFLKQFKTSHDILTEIPSIIQIESLKAENARLKHQFIDQKSSYESKIDQLKNSINQLKDKQEKPKKPKVCAQVSAQPTVSDFSTTPYLNRKNDLFTSTPLKANPKISELLKHSNSKIKRQSILDDSDDGELFTPRKLNSKRKIKLSKFINGDTELIRPLNSNFGKISPLKKRRLLFLEN